MKRFINGVVEWKKYACAMFTGTVCVYGAVVWFLGGTAIELGMLFQLLVISVLGTLIQGIAFSEEWLIRNMAYTRRMLLFVGVFLPFLTAFAVIFRWFPAGELVNWAIFLLIFLVVFVVMVLSFELVFQITGKKYDGLLGQYQKKNGQDREIED